MARTLLIGGAQRSWREWLRANRCDRDIINLDPAETVFGTPCRLEWIHKEKVLAWHHYGALDPLRTPQVFLSALPSLLDKASEPIVQLFRYRPSPVLRHIALLVAQILKPDEILIADDCEIGYEGWPVGPQTVTLESEFPDIVLSAQRKAHWMKLLEDSEFHKILMKDVAFEGSRLGSGRAISDEQLAKLGLSGTAHGEICGSTLMLVDSAEPSDDVLSRALDMTHCTRSQIVDPEMYANVVCSFARQDGEDFGLGIVQRIDFQNKVMEILCPAVSPAPVRIVKLGGLRVNNQGHELGELGPWRI